MEVAVLIGWLQAVYQHPVYFPVVALLAGIAAGVWLHWLAGRLEAKDDGFERVMAGIPTSIKIQFRQGSEQIRQLENQNVRNFLGERAQFNFLNDDGGNASAPAVLWYVFLIFKQPTSYGQIIVDAGNAEIPPYRILSSSYWGAILRFEGDIGNVALEIKCVSPEDHEEMLDLKSAWCATIY